MEFYIPGLFLFLISIIFVSIITPKLTPLVVSILSIVFLVYGVYDHYRMFQSEYRLSTWQETLKMYSPAIMIIAIIIVIIYGIFAFFTNGQVPIPNIPDIQIPSANSITNSVMTSFNSVSNSLSNSISNSYNSITNSSGNKKNNISRSFLETI